MKRLTLLCLIILLAAGARAQISGGISISNDGVNRFYLAIGQNYHVPQRDVVVIHERRIPDEEIPVVFFIATRAHVRPGAVVELRLSGQSWMDIALHYRLRPDIFYVKLSGDPGPEYGRAYGNWRHPRREWKRIRLDDEDIVKMVNLQFVSSHYRVKPEEVVRLRGQHGNFVDVAHEVESPDYRSNRGRHQDNKDNHNGDQGQGRSNDNGRSGDQQNNSRDNGGKSDKH